MTQVLSKRASAALALLLLGGCTNIPTDLGRSDVETLVAERGIEPETVPRAHAPADAGLDGETLNAERAVRIALVNSPRLQAAYARLGFGAADVYAAGRIRNPVFSFALLDASASGARDQVTFGLVTSFTDLLTMSARKRLAAAAFDEMKQSLGAEVLDVAATAERAFHVAVGAQSVALLRRQIAEAAALSARLAARYHAAGNLTPRALALEQAAASESRLAALDAEDRAARERTALANVLGIGAGGGWALPDRIGLPDGPQETLNDVLALARRSRLDLAAARAAVERHADRLGVTNRTRWLGEIALGAMRQRETDGSFLSGGTATLELPVFTQGRDRLLRADADLAIAHAEFARVSLDVENSVQLAYSNVRNALRRVSEYENRLIPQRVEALARAQQEAHYMLIGVFELLTEKQREYDAYEGYIEAVRDFWIARADLGRAVGTTLPGTSTGIIRWLDTKALFRSGARDHSMPAHSRPTGNAHGHHDVEAPDAKPGETP